MTTQFRIHPHSQSGVALVIALVFLLMLTLLGLSASQVSVQQERMSGNYLQAHLAFQDAEDNLRRVEEQLQALNDGQLHDLPAEPPHWGDDAQRAAFPSDCTLEHVYGNDWSGAPWQSLGEARYVAIRLGGTGADEDPAAAAGSPCAPMEAMTGEGGWPNRNSYFVVAVQGAGSDTNRPSQAVVQSIFYRSTN